tara:strand:+ start:61 stop:648 length:588 start_codon:yes stop_codon:yes gene_type:complete
MKSICIYAGSNTGSKDSYKKTAIELGKQIAKEGFSVVYGGGSVGLMGIMADSFLEEGGNITGVITKQLKDVEVGHKNLSKLIVVDTMHERKAKMAELSEAIIVLPGGVGTWEEFFEALAWNQLGLYSKPIVLLNTDNYYEDLYKFVEKATELGFLSKNSLEDFFLVNKVKKSIEIVKLYKPKDQKDWYKRLRVKK